MDHLNSIQFFSLWQFVIFDLLSVQSSCYNTDHCSTFPSNFYSDKNLIKYESWITVIDCFWVGARILQPKQQQDMSWMVGVQFLAGTRDFSLPYSIQTDSGAHPASYPMGKMAEAWSWPLTQTPSRRDAQLIKNRDNSQCPTVTLWYSYPVNINLCSLPWNYISYLWFALGPLLLRW
jgi:hypothetical protein